MPRDRTGWDRKHARTDTVIPRTAWQRYQADSRVARDTVRWGKSQRITKVSLDRLSVTDQPADLATPLAWLLVWEVVEEREREANGT